MEIIRALSVKLSEDVLFTVTYQYHTEKSKDDPAGKKNDRTRSRYRMLGRIERIPDIEKKIAELHGDENRLKPWKWPQDPSWDGNILYMKDASSEGRSNWLRLKIRKAVSREEAALLMKGFKKDTDLDREMKKKGRKPKPEELYTVYTPNAVYDAKGYSCSDGSTVDIDDFDALLSKTGQNVWKEIQMKTTGPGHGKTEGGTGPSRTPPEVA